MQLPGEEPSVFKVQTRVTFNASRHIAEKKDHAEKNSFSRRKCFPPSMFELLKLESVACMYLIIKKERNFLSMLLDFESNNQASFTMIIPYSPIISCHESSYTLSVSHIKNPIIS